MIRCSVVSLSLLIAGVFTSGTSYATSEEFPDIEDFTHTSPSLLYRYSSRPVTLEFSTPNGLYCWVSRYLETRFGCDGHLPSGPIEANTIRVQHSMGAQFLRTASAFTPDDPPIMLEENHYFDDGGVLCAVGENAVTACTDGNHGFVIEPNHAALW